MNKVLNINLGGLPFTIDDEAYRTLENYLQSLHNHFKVSEGYEEIMSDIEARLAELIQDGKGKRGIVTIQDVKNAVSVMGKPEDFGAESVDDAQTSAHTEGGNKSNTSSNGRTIKTGKRLYRDEDSKVLGGVCAGISAYLGINIVWVRLVWALLFFFVGTGFFLYIILWIFLPSAKTTADRLAMKGEPIDVNNIAKTVETSFEKFSEKVNEFGNPENKELIYHQMRQFSTGITNAFSGILRGIGGLGRVVVIGISIFAIVLMLILWIASAVSLSLASPIIAYISDANWRSVMVSFNAFSILACITTLLIFTIRRLVYRHSMSNGVVGGIWAFLGLSVACLAASVGSMAKEFNHSQETTQHIQMPDVETLTLAESPSPHGQVHINFGNLKVSEDFLLDDAIRLRVVKSDDGKFELVVNKESDGRTEDQAHSLVSQIKYDPSVEGDKLVLPHDFLIQKGQKWRNQHINMTLKVPVGKKIRYSRTMRTVFDFDVEKDDDDENQDKCLDSPVRFWVMTDAGFKCAL